MEITAPLQISVVLTMNAFRNWIRMGKWMILSQRSAVYRHLHLANIWVSTVIQQPLVVK